MVPDKKETQKEDRLIPGWAIGLAFILIVATGCYKFAVTQIISIDFSDLLSLILALFSIWLSVKFYSMADVASREFYNNSLSFTSHISEVLGRIEERFGEKMENIRAGLERFNPEKIIKENKEEIEIKLEEQQKILDEKQSMLKELMQKADMEATAKEEFMAKWQQSESESARLRTEIFRLKENILTAENASVSGSIMVRQTADGRVIAVRQTEDGRVIDTPKRIRRGVIFKLADNARMEDAIDEMKMQVLELTDLEMKEFFVSSHSKNRHRINFGGAEASVMAAAIKSGNTFTVIQEPFSINHIPYVSEP